MIRGNIITILNKNNNNQGVFLELKKKHIISIDE